MPAVNPTRLNLQIADLLESFNAPEEFLKKIRDLFSFYANRTLRQSDMAEMTPLLHMYHLPDPVMPQLKLALRPSINQAPQNALILADTLWQDKFFETRQIAIYLLGQTTTTEPDPIITRLENWLSPELEPVLKETILFSGTQQLQSNFPQGWSAWVESLLSRDNASWISMGLIALRAGLRSSPSEKLPEIYRMLSQFIREPHFAIMNEMTRLIEALANQSPTETAYYLKQALSLSKSSSTKRLIRQCLPFFPEEARAELQAAL
jgi:hypothetical protein